MYCYNNLDNKDECRDPNTTKTNAGAQAHLRSAIEPIVKG